MAESLSDILARGAPSQRRGAAGMVRNVRRGLAAQNMVNRSSPKPVRSAAQGRAAGQQGQTPLGPETAMRNMYTNQQPPQGKQSYLQTAIMNLLALFGEEGDKAGGVKKPPFGIPTKPTGKQNIPPSPGVDY